MRNSMTFRHHAITAASALLMTGLLAAPLSAVDVAAPAAAIATAADSATITDLKAGYAAALKERKPVLLVLGASWCGPCKVLEKEMASPDAAKALEKVIVVHLDVDTSPEARAFLHSGAIPLLRILSPTGQRIDMKEGVVKAADLARWIEERHEQAMEVADDLMETGEPGALAMPKLMARLGDTDPAFREAAIKRLLPFPHVAASHVVAAFDTGSLAVRLSSLELLREWKAPLGEIDPWRPQTINAQQIKTLTDWANSDLKPAAATEASANAPAALSPQQEAQARSDIDRMLKATAAEDARVIRDRLARLKAPLKPIVLEELAKATTDEARQRLLAMRYRLAAAEPLMIAWPGGIERLAATDVKTRHGAAQELVDRATQMDGALLLELFSDPDPFVREISLRGLRAVGKGDAAKALVGLLDDPDANVRAAVLKQLAETASPAFLPAVVAYAQKEPDADLVVHAIRVMRASKGALAMQGLQKMLTHESWRVRAEAADGLAELASGYDPFAESNKATIYVSMIRLLEDPDSFVVSRAALALRNAETPLVVEPMAKATLRFPELAGDLIAGMVGNSQGRQQTEKHLRAFCKHEDERLRAQAIAALVDVTTEIETEIEALLKDPAVTVRSSAATALFQWINASKPRSSDVISFQLPFPVEAGNGKAVDVATWIAEYREGKNRPAWLAAVLPELQQLMREKSAAYRLAGALPLLALAPIEQSYPVVTEAVTAEPGLASAAAQALPWLPVPQRVELFNRLALVGGKQLYSIVSQMSSIPDAAAADAMWNMLESDKATEDVASSLLYGLRSIYLGEQYYRVEEMSAAQRKTALEQIGKRATGNELQKLVVLALLSYFAQDDAARFAQQFQTDESSSKELKADAFKARLLTLPALAASKVAAEALIGDEAALHSPALSYLAVGGDDISHLRGGISIQHMRDFSRFEGGKAVIYPPPAFISADQLKGVLKRAAPDSSDAAHAGYLLALHKDREGLDVLLSYANKKEDKHLRFTLVVRAIAAVNSPDHADLLEEIYQDMRRTESYYLREFYWTIRSMTGEKILLLRKKIRDEVGMEALR